MAHHLTLTALTAALLFSAQKPETKTVRIDGGTVEISHYADEPANGRLTIRVRTGGKLLGELKPAGKPNWTPWGLQRATAVKLQPSGRTGALVESFCGHGGSGTAIFLSLVTIEGGKATLTDIAASSKENIHDGVFAVATTPQGTGFVATEPLMDGPSRGDATRWRVSCYRIQGGKSVHVSSKQTTKRYSESLPPAEIAKLLPKAWKLYRP